MEGSNNSNYDEANELLTRMINLLKSDDFERADACADHLLYLLPGFGPAYLGKLLAEFRLHEMNDLLYTEESYTTSDNYKQALNYSDPDTQRFLRTAPYENFYLRAKKRMSEADSETDFKAAAGMFRQISGYRDADRLFRQCSETVNNRRLEELYEKAEQIMQSAVDESSLKAAADAYACLNGYRDSGEKRNICLQKINDDRSDLIYNGAVALMENQNLESLQEAYDRFDSIRDWKDADQKAEGCRLQIQKIKQASRKKTTKKLLLFTGLFLIAAAVCAVVFLVIPLSKYNYANELLRDGFLTEAKEAFTSLNGFRDSELKAKEIDNLLLDRQYDDAVRQVENGDFVKGIETLLSLDGYRNSVDMVENALMKKANALNNMEISEIAAEIEAMDPEITSAILERMDPGVAAKMQMYAAVVGDVLIFGHYEQDNDPDNGAEPIEWIVLDHQKGALTLISRYALDIHPYHETDEAVTWSECSLRRWLNESFYDSAFTLEEHSLISLVNNMNRAYTEGLEDEPETADLVYLLDVAEAERYFISDAERCLEATVYARSKGAGIEDGVTTWWLRSSGYDLRNAAYIYTDGAIHRNGIYVTSEQDAVRPVIQIVL